MMAILEEDSRTAPTVFLPFMSPDDHVATAAITATRGAIISTCHFPASSGIVVFTQRETTTADTPGDFWIGLTPPAPTGLGETRPKWQHDVCILGSAVEASTSIGATRQIWHIDVIPGRSGRKISAISSLVEGKTFLSELLDEIYERTHDPLEGYERYFLRDWDNFDADPISPETLNAARRFLQILPAVLGEPDIAPGTDGTIGFEWVHTDKNLRKLFIDIGPGYLWGGYWRKATGERQTISPQQIDLGTEQELYDLFYNLMS